MDVKTKMQAFLLGKIRERLEDDLDDMEYVIRNDYTYAEANLTEWCDNMETLFMDSLKERFERELFAYLLKCDYPSECHAYIMGCVYREMARAINLHSIDEEFESITAVMKKVANDTINGKEE